MAFLDQIGTTLATGAETITGSYLVQSREQGEKDVDLTDVDDENGVLKTRLIKKRHAKLTLDAILIEGADPGTDFPVGAIAVHTDFTDYYVDSAVLTKDNSGAHRVRVSMTNIGISA